MVGGNLTSQHPFVLLFFSSLSITRSLSLGDVDLKRREAVKRKIAEILEHAERLLSVQTPTQDHDT